MIPAHIRSTVRDYIRAHHIFEPGPIVVAVSGGPDSTALLLILADLAEEIGLVLHVAHFDHRTRPKQSALDADFVAKLANRVGAPIRVGRADRATKTEDAARQARYAFLRRAAAEVGALAIATGHTRDDQAETVLLHLVRGSGIAGLAGMRPLRHDIARPLLAIGHADTVAVCRALRIRPRSDPTNRSLRFARNRVRLKVMPELARINPQTADAIARLADAAAAYEGSRADAPADALAGATQGNVIALAALPEGPARSEALALAWQRSTGRELASRHRSALASLTATTEGSRAIDLPGGRAVREYATLRIELASAPSEIDPPRLLTAGAEIEWNGWRIALGDTRPQGDGAVEATIAEASLGTLRVRSRMPGDRSPGTPGRKLQDVFVDAKIPAAERPRWPVIASDAGVLWVPFLTVPAYSGAGMRLAVAAPKQMGNDLWTTRVREVASKAAAVGRPRRGRRN